MIDRERLRPLSSATLRRLASPEGKPVRITAHFWVTDRLYEVDYDRTVRSDGRTGLIRVPGSERRCQCPGRDDAEQGRRERGRWRPADALAADAREPSVGGFAPLPNQLPQGEARARTASATSHEVSSDKLTAPAMEAGRR